MTTDKWIKDKLEADTSFTGVEVHPVVLPQGKDYPAVIIHRVDSVPENIKGSTAPQNVERWSIAIWAGTLAKVRSLESAVLSVLNEITDDSENIQRMWHIDTSSDRYFEDLELFTVNVDFYLTKTV